MTFTKLFPKGRPEQFLAVNYGVACTSLSKYVQVECTNDNHQLHFGICKYISALHIYIYTLNLFVPNFDSQTKIYIPYDPWDWHIYLHEWLICMV